VALLRGIAAKEKRATLLQLCEQWKHRALGKEDKERAVVQLLLDGVLQEEFAHTAFSTNSYITRGPSLPLLEHGEAKHLANCLMRTTVPGEIGTRNHSPMPQIFFLAIQCEHSGTKWAP
jgi:hypothetical protein